LKDLGLPIDYVYKGSSLLEVRNNAVLTIEPGVTIQFTKTDGGIKVTDGACINAAGMADKHIQFIGTGTEKGSWYGVDVRTTSDNQFKYVDFINSGSAAANVNTYAVLTIYDAKCGVSHCKISGGLGYGIYINGGNHGGPNNTRITAFDNNVVENVDYEPVYLWYISHASIFDMTSDFTQNTKPYIKITPGQTLSADATLNQTTVPYYIADDIDYMNKKLTINAGVTIYMGVDNNLTGSGAVNEGVIFINGTVEKPVTFTRLPGTTSYWGTVYFRGLIGSRIENCIFEYGGNHNDRGMIDIASESDLTLTNVVIRNSYNYGVRIDEWGGNYRLTHSNVTFANNYKGNVYMSRAGTVLTQLP
jgi:hypothetical protein